MKKVLLGLLALSATLMAAPSTGETGNAGENQIDIKTKAYIVNSGLIITGDASGNTAIKSVELDHGTILVGTNTNSTTTRTVYIRRVAGAAFPKNTVLEVALNSPTGNNLTNSARSGSMAHTLTAHVNRITEPLSLSGEKKEQSIKFPTGDEDDNIPVVLTSTIDKEQYASTKKMTEGEYNNTSTLSVKFSKNPGMQTEPADKPVEALR
ncbi:MAG: hypothetical protein ACRDDH_04600 [Cetobacterium sp.]|uniref:hypothetical protein n=1 Tax=Cetobacterium sp. TaxID=2071632 RepID=UPI003EE652BC